MQKPLNIKLILLLSILGLAAGFIAIYPTPVYVVLVLRILILGFSAYTIMKRCESRFFLHGFLAGFVGGLWNVVIHALLYTKYSIYHGIELVKATHILEMVEIPKTNTLILVRIFLLASILLGGIVWGLLMGFLSFLASRNKP